MSVLTLTPGCLVARRQSRPCAFGAGGGGSARPLVWLVGAVRLSQQWVSDGVGIPIMSPADESSCTAMVLDFRPTNEAPQYGFRSSKEAGGSGRNRSNPAPGPPLAARLFPLPD